MPKHHAKILKTYAGLLGLTACSYTLMYGPQPMFNLISWDLNVNKAHIGLLVSVFMLALSLAPLVVGLFLSRLGLRRAVFLACLILTLSGVGIYFSSSFSGLLLVRILQGILVPVVLTSVMAGIASLFRHLDLARALAGFVTASLLGSLAGRILGGLLATTFSWRLTLIGFGLLFTLGLYLTKNLPAKFPGQNKPHSLKDYLRVLKFKGLAPLLLIEACGIFTFAAIGNL
ncbi:MAG: MFS transporter, partial [Desulfovibrionaceae bacterium]|nr:MFS transporter [Desulfovibrionaceae bacterium]